MQKYIKKNRYYLFDFLKGLSIFTIIVFHLVAFFLSNIPDIIKKASYIGGTGVHIFIMASGFGLYYTYSKDKLSYIKFLKHRLNKLYLPYILIILISCFSGLYLLHGLNKFKVLLSHIFLYKMFFEKYETTFGGQMWFISTILQFYIIFYLLVYLKEKLGNKLFLFGSLLISITWWIIVARLGKSDIRVWNSFFLQYLWEFSFGILIAEYYSKDMLPKKVNNYLLIVIGIIGILFEGILGLKGGNFRIFNDIPAALGYGSLCIVIYNFKFKYINNLFIKLSSFSYELYLLHWIIFVIVFSVFQNYNVYTGLLLGVVALILCIIFSRIYHLIFQFINQKINN